MSRESSESLAQEFIEHAGKYEFGDDFELDEMRTSANFSKAIKQLDKHLR